MNLSEVFLARDVRIGSTITGPVLRPTGQIEKLLLHEASGSVLLKAKGHKTLVIPQSNIVDMVPEDDPLAEPKGEQKSERSKGGKQA